MSEVRDAIVVVQGIARAMTGMREAPNDPRAGMVAFPFAISYAGRGAYSMESSQSKGIHHIITDIHCAREAELAQAVGLQLGFLDEFTNDILANPTLSGTVSTIVVKDEGPSLSYTFGPTNYCGVPTIVLRFDLTVKIQTAVT